MSAWSSDGPVDRAIAGALRATINEHGPITKELIPSAVKRVRCQLKARVRELNEARRV